MKTCPKCKVEKLLEDFYVKKKTGRPHSYCKSCNKNQVTEWKEKEPRKALELRRKYYKNKRPYSAYKKAFCERCGFIPEHSCQLDVDHQDENHSNDATENLVTLCANCHRLKSRAHSMLEPDRTEWLQQTGFK
jgi:hypothetical protein